MAIVVEYHPNGSRYILLGTGFGAFKSSVPSVFLGNLSPSEDKGELLMAAICNSKGKIFWVKSEDLEVIEIDGKSPAEISRDYNQK